MKIHDFDEKFYDYVRTWMALHPGLNERQIEESYNEMMTSWLNATATWLNGEKPGVFALMGAVVVITSITGWSIFGQEKQEG